jgi:hypothetical protein
MQAIRGARERRYRDEPVTERGARLYDVIDHWQRAPVFRAELRSDPEGAVRKLGIELSDAEWAGLRELVSG